MYRPMGFPYRLIPSYEVVGNVVAGVTNYSFR